LLDSSSRSKAWSKAFARQALSDLRVYVILETASVERCHSLHFLQMAAEKVCKAHLHATGNIVKDSHSVVRKHLVSIARKFGSQRALSGNRLKGMKLLAAEIDLLAPALRDDGSRQDNVEYPWLDNLGSVIAPVDFEFSSIESGRVQELLKLLRLAASEYAA
jgi:hypothetical protein